MSKNQLFLLSAPLVSFLFGYFTLYYFYRPINIKMPNLIGLALNDALTVVTSLGCVLSDYGQIVSEQYTVSTIITQSPSAFNNIKEGQTIFVTIGQPPPLKKTPSFVGQKECEIQKLAELHSLYIHIKRVYYYGLDDICCGQFPESDLLLSDQFIIVYIAKNLENRFIMPLLIGRQYRDAEYFLMQHDMILHSNKIAQDDMVFHTITKQIPFFGDLVPMKKGFVVDVQLSISKGR